MGGSSSRPAQYPLPMPGQYGYNAPQQMWSVTGKGRSGRGRSNSDGYFMAMPNPNGYYPYGAQPYPYYPAQGFSSAYYPQAGGVPPAATQAVMPQPQPQPQSMPAPNSAPVQPTTGYNPAAVPPPPVTMPAPPQTQGGFVPPQQQQPQQPPVRSPRTDGPAPVIPPTIPPARNEYQDADGRPNPSVYGPPGPRPRTPIKNPLPTPPRDLYEMSPYRSLLRALPVTTSILSRQHNTAPAPTVESRRNGGGGFGSFLGSKSGRDKKPRKGLFRSFSASDGRNDAPAPPLTSLFGGGPVQRSATFTGVPNLPSVYPQNGTANDGTSMPPSNSAPAAHSTAAPAAADPAPPRPVRFDHNSPLAGFMNHSPHRIMHQNQLYPTALHLLEALKFLAYHPDLAERIRAVKDARDVYSVSAAMQEFVRADWGQVFLQMAEEVLYLKFKQHPDLRGQLMNTGTAEIIYSEANDPYWGEGQAGQGTNELGKAIMRARERLRKEGYSVGPPVNSGPAQS